jgi:hypothetical protein
MDDGSQEKDVGTVSGLRSAARRPVIVWPVEGVFSTQKTSSVSNNNSVTGQPVLSISSLKKAR